MVLHRDCICFQEKDKKDEDVNEFVSAVAWRPVSLFLIPYRKNSWKTKLITEIVLKMELFGFSVQCCVHKKQTDVSIRCRQMCP